MSKSTSAVELNRVRDSTNTKQAIQSHLLGAEGVWEGHIKEGINAKNQLFLIRLAFKEGEFALGLGYRTFNEKLDVAGVKYEIEWYERKSKKSDWGQKPGFKRCIASYTAQRQKVYKQSVEKLTSFFPVKVDTTAGSSMDEPVLTKNCTDAIREALAKGKVDEESGEESDEASGEESSEESGEEGDEESGEEGDEESGEESDEESDDESDDESSSKRRRKQP